MKVHRNSIWEYGVVLAGGLLLIVFFSAGWISTSSADSHAMFAPKFNASGEMIRPEGAREWIYVGTPLTPNSLNPPQAPFPEFHSVYIDPESWAHYKKTGQFRDGTVPSQGRMNIRDPQGQFSTPIDTQAAISHCLRRVPHS